MANKPYVDLSSRSQIMIDRLNEARARGNSQSKYVYTQNKARGNSQSKYVYTKHARNVHIMETGEHLSSSVAGSALKFLLIIPLMFALFASLNGGSNVMHFETMLDMLAGAPALDISWIPKISGWTSGMSDIAQKIFGFILKPIEWSMYIITGLSQVLTFIGYIFYYIFAF